jgi:hypothetical protein
MRLNKNAGSLNYKKNQETKIGSSMNGSGSEEWKKVMLDGLSGRGGVGRVGRMQPQRSPS